MNAAPAAAGDVKDHVDLGGGDDNHGEENRPPARGQPLGNGVDDLDLGGGDDGHGEDKRPAARGRRLGHGVDDLDLGGGNDGHGEDEQPPARELPLGHGVDGLHGQNGGDTGGTEMTKEDYSCSKNSIKYAVYPNTIKNLNTSPAALLLKSEIVPKWQQKLENRMAKNLETKRLVIFDDRDSATVESGASV